MYLSGGLEASETIFKCFVTHGAHHAIGCHVMRFKHSTARSTRGMNLLGASHEAAVLALYLQSEFLLLSLSWKIIDADTNCVCATRLAII